MQGARHFLTRPVAVLLVAALLVTGPAKPAHAFVPAILAAAVSYIGEQLLSALSGTGTIQSVLLAIETELPIIQSTIEMKINENTSKARSILEQERQKRLAYWASMRDRPTDFQQANCQAATPLLDGTQHRQRTDAIDLPLIMGDIRVQNSRGDALAGRNGLSSMVSGRTKTSDDIKARISEANLEACRYGTVNQKALRATLQCPAGDPPIENNPYALADQKATTLFGASAFTEDRHYAAATDYCYALTGHTILPYAQGRAKSENIDNIRQFLVSLSDTAARDISIAACAPLLLNRVPLNVKFAKTDAAFQPLLSKMQQAAASSTTGGRTYEQMDATDRKYLLQSGGYTEVAAAAFQADGTGAKQLVKGQLLSRQQKDEADYVYRWFDPSFVNKKDGPPTSQLQQLLFTKAANMSLQWRRYEQLELETMNEAVQLAKLVRNAPEYGDPGTAAPTQ